MRLFTHLRIACYVPAKTTPSVPALCMQPCLLGMSTASPLRAHMRGNAAESRLNTHRNGTRRALHRYKEILVGLHIELGIVLHAPAKDTSKLFRMHLHHLPFTLGTSEPIGTGDKVINAPPSTRAPLEFRFSKPGTNSRTPRIRRNLEK